MSCLYTQCTNVLKNIRLLALNIIIVLTIIKKVIQSVAGGMKKNLSK